MKLKHNWRQRTLENLENDYWSKPDYDSHLVQRCHELRKIPLEISTGPIGRMVIVRTNRTPSVVSPGKQLVEMISPFLSTPKVITSKSQRCLLR